VSSFELQQPGQNYSYEPSGYASSNLAAAPSVGYAQSELSQPQYAVQGINFTGVHLVSIVVRTLLD